MFSLVFSQDEPGHPVYNSFSTTQTIWIQQVNITKIKLKQVNKIAVNLQLGERDNIFLVIAQLGETFYFWLLYSWSMPFISG